MPDATQFERIIKVLTDSGVRFVLIGGVAMRLHGAAHITDDIDLCYDRDPENLVRLAASLRPFHVRLRGAPADLPFLFDARTLAAGLNFTLSTDLGSVDLLGEVPGIESFEALWNRASVMELPDAPVRIAALSDLVVMKRAANRAKDRAHLIELERLRALIEEGDAEA